MKLMKNPEALGPIEEQLLSEIKNYMERKMRSIPSETMIRIFTTFTLQGLIFIMKQVLPEKREEAFKNIKRDIYKALGEVNE